MIIMITIIIVIVVIVIVMMTIIIIMIVMMVVEGQLLKGARQRLTPAEGARRITIATTLSVITIRIILCLLLL